MECFGINIAAEEKEISEITSGHDCRSGRFAIKSVRYVFACLRELLNDERIATQHQLKRIDKAGIQIIQLFTITSTYIQGILFVPFSALFTEK
jgi:hypothetical protein